MIDVLVTPTSLYVLSGRSREQASFICTRLVDTVDTNSMITLHGLDFGVISQSPTCLVLIQMSITHVLVTCGSVPSLYVPVAKWLNDVYYHFHDDMVGAACMIQASVDSVRYPETYRDILYSIYIS